MQRLFQPIGDLKSVSKKRNALYQKIGIHTPYELLWHLPRLYQDYREPVPVADTVIGMSATVKVKITSKKNPVYTRSGMEIFQAEAVDDANTKINITIFNQRFTFQGLSVGNDYILSGRIKEDTYHENCRMIQNPKILSDEKNPLEAVYPQTAGLTSPMIRTNIKECLGLLDAVNFETLSPELRDQYQIVSLTKAFHDVHQPETMEQVIAAKHRLAFEEQLRLELGLHMLKMHSQVKTDYPMRDVSIKPFLDSLPFQLTNAQLQAITEITQDLSGDMPMNRLLQGDVGSGKTAVAIAACYFCVQNGYQSVLMAPTEILAEQHYKTFCDFLGKFEIEIVLLTGSLTPKQKKLRYAKIADGSAKVIIGTHAVFQKAVTYCNLGLVITDEQHRFGVAQRDSLAEKGGMPHKLVMSATPIPRTLALVIYGDLEISVLDAMPNGRLPVKTYAITGKIRDRAMNFVKQELQKGHQAYIVCPAIEDSEMELKAVTAYAELCKKDFLKDWNIAILHGQMSAQEKDTVMGQFRNHETDVLICTTVVEVGVDVPNATIMVIEDADRFGLSQLHQLRGRVGRSNHQSYCVLVTEHVTEESRERLRLLCSTTDGFAIAEADLQLRKAGDFFGNKQHGLPPMRLAGLIDSEMLDEIRQVRETITEQDQYLEYPENQALRISVSQLFC